MNLIATAVGLIVVICVVSWCSIDNPKPSEIRVEAPPPIEEVISYQLDCSTNSYTSNYLQLTSATPPSVQVVFSKKPSSGAAQKAVERCMRVAAEKFSVTAEILGTAWYSATGKEIDLDQVTMKDGSSSLLFTSTENKMITFNQWKKENQKR